MTGLLYRSIALSPFFSFPHPFSPESSESTGLQRFMLHLRSSVVLSMMRELGSGFESSKLYQKPHTQRSRCEGERESLYNKPGYEVTSIGFHM